MQLVEDGVLKVLREFSQRFEEAARQDTKGLTIVYIEGNPNLMPTEAHGVFELMRRSKTAEEARELAENFLGRIQKNDNRGSEEVGS